MQFGHLILLLICRSEKKLLVNAVLLGRAAKIALKEKY